MSSSQLSGSSAFGLRILVVEDEIMIALLLEDMLATLGHTVVGPVSRVDKALEMVASEALDVAILDVNLNGREVYPVAETLAARGIPFIFATGYGDVGLSTRFRDRPILSKPFDRNTLHALIESCRAPR